jgi:D-alanyl-lipoteichoic acid acyltransferase DltB (MBOAT superfamily)
MTLTHILVFGGLALPFMWWFPVKWRSWGLLVGSVLAIGWLQHNDSSVGADFVLPAATVILTVAVWWIVQPSMGEDDERQRDNWVALGLIGAALGVVWISTGVANGALDVMPILSGVALVGVGAVSAAQLLPRKIDEETTLPYRRLALVMIGGIILILVVLKVPALARFLGGVFGTEQVGNTSVSPLVWLGFSYISFRLMSVLLDFRAGRLPKEGFPLRDMATYVLFFPAFTAGPIDRAQHFIPDLQEHHALDAGRLVDGGTRIAVGVFKKFVVADSLALTAMNTTLIDRTDSVWGLWLILYLYAFQIFFDFSGYSDVAIGIGKLYGISLPENFDRPYLQQNIQQFWQRWHITLSTWFRIYFFTPFSRLFIRSQYKFPQYVVVLLAQVSTMLLIGLWHGVTINFALWGIWHGLGLFGHKYLADHTRTWYRRVSQKTRVRRLIYGVSVFATFNFVALGWVFFALPEPSDSFDLLIRLFGGS